VSTDAKNGKHVIILGAGASLSSGYPLADRLRLLLTSPRALRDYLYERFEVQDLKLRSQIWDRLAFHRKSFDESLKIFRRGGFSTVDEFCYLANDQCAAEVKAAKTYMRHVLLMVLPEWTFHKSEYYRFVQKLFDEDLKSPREDITVLSYNYDPVFGIPARSLLRL
jgi:hypothetical protein